MYLRVTSFKNFRVFVLALWLSLPHISCSESIEKVREPRMTVGWLEQVRVSPSNILLHAKLDTGADNCSMHAEDIQIKDKQVSFELVNRYGTRERLSRRLIRIAKVKKKAGGVQRRPVVRLGLCLGGVFENIECNLVDRSHFEYPVLVGRNYLAGQNLVDSSETYITEPVCDSENAK